MTDLDRRIWEWLPGRRDSRRVTDVAIIAVNLDAETSEIAPVVDRLVREGRVIRTQHRGHTGHYRGHWPYPTTTPDPGLWETA